MKGVVFTEGLYGTSLFVGGFVKGSSQKSLSLQESSSLFERALEYSKIKPYKSHKTKLQDRSNKKLYKTKCIACCLYH
eukprot:5964659-Amphidinium_carterae.1